MEGWFYFIGTFILTDPIFNASQIDIKRLEVMSVIRKLERGEGQISDILGIMESIYCDAGCVQIGTDQTINANTVDIVSDERPIEDWIANHKIISTWMYWFNARAEKQPPNRIQLRGRTVEIWNTALHLSVSRANIWYSGFPQNGGLATLVNPGHLVKKSLNTSDDPMRTMLIGSVQSESQSDDALWLQIQGRFLIYDNQELDYCALPDVTNTCYNSNSFARGLVESAEGEIDESVRSDEAPALDIGNYPGFTKPVPKTYFGG